jgi:hypothetical protein
MYAISQSNSCCTLLDGKLRSWVQIPPLGPFLSFWENTVLNLAWRLSDKTCQQKQQQQQPMDLPKEVAVVKAHLLVVIYRLEYLEKELRK